MLQWVPAEKKNQVHNLGAFYHYIGIEMCQGIIWKCLAQFECKYAI